MLSWIIYCVVHNCGTWWHIGWGDYFQPKGRGLGSSRHARTLGKSFTYSCLCASAWNSDVNVFSHLLSAAYMMTSGPLHVSLGIIVTCKHSKPMIHNSSLAGRIRGMQRGIRTSWAASWTVQSLGLTWCRLEAWIQYPCCSRDHLWVVEDLKGRYRNGQNELNEWMNWIPSGPWSLLTFLLYPIECVMSC